MSDVLKRKFPYIVDYLDKGVYNHSTLVMFEEPLKNSLVQKYQVKHKKTRVENALAWIRFAWHPTDPVLVINETQSDVIANNDLTSSEENRYKYWYRWLFYEFLLLARDLNVEKIYVPTALQMYLKWIALRNIRAQKRRIHEEVFGRNVSEYTAAWRRIYDQTVELFGGTIQQVWGDDDYLLLERHLMMVDYLWVVDVENAIQLAENDLSG